MTSKHLSVPLRVTEVTITSNTTCFLQGSFQARAAQVTYPENPLVTGIPKIE